VTSLLRRLWSEDEGQDIAEYAVMLAVILVLVVGPVRLFARTRTTLSPAWRARFSRTAPPLLIRTLHEVEVNE
jgi:Flp pilus assembly pilin Flp